MNSYERQSLVPIGPALSFHRLHSASVARLAVALVTRLFVGLQPPGGGDHEVREDGINVVFGFHAVKNNTQVMMLPMSARHRIAMMIQSCRRSTRARRVFHLITLRRLGRIRLLPPQGVPRGVGQAIPLKVESLPRAPRVQ